MAAPFRLPGWSHFLCFGLTSPGIISFPVHPFKTASNTSLNSAFSDISLMYMRVIAIGSSLGAISAFELDFYSNWGRKASAMPEFLSGLGSDWFCWNVLVLQWKLESFCWIRLCFSRTVPKSCLYRTYIFQITSGSQ